MKKLLLCLLLTCLLLALVACNDAISVTDATVDENGDLIITYSDGSTQNAGHVKGDKGDTGSPGSNGSPGANATINGVNTLTIKAGTNVSLSQSGSTLTINASGGATATAMTVAQVRAICV